MHFAVSTPVPTFVSVAVQNPTWSTNSKNTFYDMLCNRQGRKFESLLFKILATIIGSSLTRTSAWHPASNGMIERLVCPDVPCLWTLGQSSTFGPVGNPQCVEGLEASSAELV
jgi:hypothetical protein